MDGARSRGPTGPAAALGAQPPRSLTTSCVDAAWAPRPPRARAVDGGRETGRDRGRDPRSRRASRTPAALGAPMLGDAPRAAPARARSATNGERSRSVRACVAPAPSSGGAAPELDREVHDDPLALGVDGRVGDLRERLAQVVGDAVGPVRGRPAVGVSSPMRPERLVGLEGHRLDVEPLALGVEARDPALARGVVASGTTTARAPAPRSSWSARSRRRVGSRAAPRPGRRASSTDRRRALGVHEEHLAGPEAPALEPCSAARSGPRRLRTRRPRGRRARRSPRAAAGRCDRACAPTRRPSLKHEGGRAVPRRQQAARRGAGTRRARRARSRRSSGASGIASRSAASSRQPDATRRSSASSSESESEPPGMQQRARAPRARRPSGPPSGARRPRSCSRLPRTVLISPLWARRRNGWASAQVGCVFVA